MNEFGLSERALAIIENIFSQFPQINTVLVYGSRALGTYRDGSDIDMAIIADGGFLNVSLVKDLFYDSALPYLVDISDFSSLTNEALKDHIQRCGKPIYEKKPVVTCAKEHYML